MDSRQGRAAQIMSWSGANCEPPVIVRGQLSVTSFMTGLAKVRCVRVLVTVTNFQRKGVTPRGAGYDEVSVVSCLSGGSEQQPGSDRQRSRRDCRYRLFRGSDSGHHRPPWWLVVAGA